ncbi:MAG: hypothetical protein NTX79_01745 [Candidatus Micrarchaeota archaeon]|nr:hypothetical protein [Candidatus Micrarchaeota archaeon]
MNKLLILGALLTSLLLLFGCSETCMGNVPVGSCIPNTSMYCFKDGNAQENVSKCGCPPGQIANGQSKCEDIVCQNGSYLVNNNVCLSPINVSYRELMRNNEQYVGKLVYFRGRISQVWGYDQKTQDFGMSDGTLLNYIYVSDYSGERLLQDDVVEMVGEVTGLYTYTTAMQTEQTVPKVKAINVKRD